MPAKTNNQKVMKTIYFAHVLRAAGSDCSNNGITARYNHLNLFSEDWTLSEIEEYLASHPTINRETCIQVETLWRGSFNETKRANVVFQRPRNEGTYVGGGNYVNVYAEEFHHPITVLDRFETWEEFDVLSR